MNLASIFCYYFVRVFLLVVGADEEDTQTVLELFTPLETDK
jgi:hypothetical protein